MARFYAHYTNTTVGALEVVNVSNCYDRRVVNATNAGTARTAILAQRASLSATFYATILAANRNGNAGVVVAANGYTDNGTTFSGSNIYTNTGAVWPADPRVRPTSQINVSGSTAVTPADAFSVPSADVAAARQTFTDYMDAITGGSPYIRFGGGTNPWRTFASIWHDHDMTYFAWDDFTPGTVTGLTAAKTSIDPEPLDIRISWSGYEFLNDQNPDARVRIQATMFEIGVPGNSYTVDTGFVAPPDPYQYDWAPAGVSPTGNYTLNVTVTCRDPVIVAHEGVAATFQTVIAAP